MEKCYRSIVRIMVSFVFVVKIVRSRLMQPLILIGLRPPKAIAPTLYAPNIRNAVFC